MGVCIETLYLCFTVLLLTSHPIWVCVLKHTAQGRQSIR